MGMSKASSAKSKPIGFKMGISKPKVSPLGVFANSAIEDEEPEEAPPQVKPATARASLPPPSAAEPMDVGLAAGLAAAQAVAARFNDQLAAKGVIDSPRML